MTIKLMSYNTQHCLNFVTQKIDYDIMVDTIKKCEADIIGLQEIRDEAQDAEYQAQAKNFTEDELRQAVEECVASEEAVKTGTMNDRMSVELLILKYSKR